MSVRAGIVLAGFAAVAGLLGSAWPVDAGVPPPPGSTFDGEIIYLSSRFNRSVNGLPFRDEDVLKFDTTTEEWSLAFDGSDVGLRATDLDGVHVVATDPDLVMDVSISTTRFLTGFGSG